jgi:hypothetical protein
MVGWLRNKETEVQKSLVAEIVLVNAIEQIYSLTIRMWRCSSNIQ